MYTKFNFAEQIYVSTSTIITTMNEWDNQTWFWTFDMILTWKWHAFVSDETNLDKKMKTMITKYKIK